MYCWVGLLNKRYRVSAYVFAVSLVYLVCCGCGCGCGCLVAGWLLAVWPLAVQVSRSVRKTELSNNRNRNVPAERFGRHQLPTSYQASSLNMLGSWYVSYMLPEQCIALYDTGRQGEYKHSGAIYTRRHKHTSLHLPYL